MKPLTHFSLIVLLILSLLCFVAACGDDDDDDDQAPVDDDVADDDVADDDVTDDDVTDDDVTDDDSDDDTGDDDTGDDDTADDDTPETTEGFKYIPAGTFTMGSPVNEQSRREDENAHDVTLTNGFEIQATEVTQGQFKEIMKFNPSFFPSFGNDPNLPVEQVSWFDALAFANKLSDEYAYAQCYTLSDIVCADGEAGNTVNYCRNNGGIASASVALNGVASVYECEGFRLPTESEWEYAARAGSTTAFYNGPITQISCEPLDDNLDKIGWYCGNAKYETHPVGEKDPNDWGLYDTAGNVKEWTWDWYERTYPGAVTDPEGPTDGHYRAVRGCTYRFAGAVHCRSAYRAAHTPAHRIRHVGFRLARTLPEAKLSQFSPSFAYPVTTGANMPFGLDKEWPDELPFEFTRPQVGDPLTQEEIDDFTAKMTGFFKDTNFFHYLLWVSHGMSDTNPWDQPPFKIYWQDTQAVKAGGEVTFVHTGNADNVMIGGGKVFNNAAALYLATGDEMLARYMEQYCKGVVALIRGLRHDENDPEPYLMARAIFPSNNSYEEEGRAADVNYDAVKHEVYDWNAHTIPNDSNPDYGDIWVRNMRSKDDVPHIYRIVPMVMRLVQDSPDPEVVAAAETALTYLRGFTQDIVDAGYHIRTKDKFGDQFLPLSENGMVNDLASFTLYNPIAPKAECNAQLTSALIGYGSDLDRDCLNGIGVLYEVIATMQHYYNWAIIRYFHIAAAINALMVEENDVAYEMLGGLATRSDSIMNDENGPLENAVWWPDYAGWLMAAGTAGLPLTNEEARLVVEQYSLAADHYITWPYYDLWDASVPDGTYSYNPSRNAGSYYVVEFEEVLHLFEYCYSPFRNPESAPLIDCDVLLDPEQW